MEDTASDKRMKRSARRKLLSLTGDEYAPTLRILAYLTIVRVFDRLGRFTIAANALDDCGLFVRHIRDPVLKGLYRLRNSRRYYKRADYLKARRELETGTMFIRQSVDKDLMAAAYNWEAVLLSRDGQHEEALRRLSQALEAQLIAGNFDDVQATCYNIGTVLHRMGKDHLHTAVHWLEVCVQICDTMKIGRYEALAEARLARIALEQGSAYRFMRWYKKTVRLAERSTNPLDRVEAHIARALDFQRLYQVDLAKKELIIARQIYMRLAGFGYRAMDDYLKGIFPREWTEVRSSSSLHRNSPQGRS
jgi:tetratricopeptide (TPR) repeat protein